MRYEGPFLSTLEGCLHTQYQKTHRIKKRKRELGGVQYFQNDTRALVQSGLRYKYSDIDLSLSAQPYMRRLYFSGHRAYDMSRYQLKKITVKCSGIRQMDLDPNFKTW